MTPRSDMGFDDDGEPVAAVGFQYPKDGEPEAGSSLDLEPILDALLTGVRDTKEVGERVVFLAYLLDNVAGRPKSLRELAVWLGTSHVTARTRLNTFKAEIARELAPLLNRPPIDEHEHLY